MTKKVSIEDFKHKRTTKHQHDVQKLYILYPRRSLNIGMILRNRDGEPEVEEEITLNGFLFCCDKAVLLKITQPQLTNKFQATDASRHLKTKLFL